MINLQIHNVTSDFTTADITLFKVNIFYEKIGFETLFKKIKSIKKGYFISDVIKRDIISNPAEKTFPALQLSGDGFQILVYPSSINLIAVLSHTNGMFSSFPPDQFDSPEKIFSKNNLQKLSLDYNAAVKMILDTLDVDYTKTNVLIRIDLEKNNTHFQANMFNKEADLALQSILGESMAVQSTGMAFKTKEDFHDVIVDAHYNLSNFGDIDNKKIVFNGMLYFKNTGIQDLHMIVTDYLKRINHVTKKLVGGLVIVE